MYPHFFVAQLQKEPNPREASQSSLLLHETGEGGGGWQVPRQTKPFSQLEMGMQGSPLFSEKRGLQVPEGLQNRSVAQEVALWQDCPSVSCGVHTPLSEQYNPKAHPELVSSDSGLTLGVQGESLGSPEQYP